MLCHASPVSSALFENEPSSIGISSDMQRDGPIRKKKTPHVVRVLIHSRQLTKLNFQRCSEAPEHRTSHKRSSAQTRVSICITEARCIMEITPRWITLRACIVCTRCPPRKRKEFLSFACWRIISRPARDMKFEAVADWICTAALHFPHSLGRLGSLNKKLPCTNAVREFSDYTEVNLP